MRIGRWSDINWSRVWLAVFIGLIVLLLTMPIWGWWLEGWLLDKGFWQ